MPRETGGLVAVTKGGMATIPASVRRNYRLRPGAKLEVVQTAEGILLKPVPRLADLAGVDGVRGLRLVRRQGSERRAEIRHDNDEA